MPANKAMLKMNDEKEEPHSSTAAESQEISVSAQRNAFPRGNPHIASNTDSKQGIMAWIKNNFKAKNDTTLRETIEEFIEESNANANGESHSSHHERILITNILKLHDMPASDVMIPRVDIVAVDASIGGQELLAKLADIQYSRVPVYKEQLDDVLGTIHIKDVISALAKGQELVIEDLIRDIPVIAPSMSVLDLLLEMRHSRKHMAMVVDEFGGIDGLVTVGDIIEAIVGHLEDEHDTDAQPALVIIDDRTIIVDSRYEAEEFEARYGKILTEEERDDNDTLGGLAFYMAGRVPERGEILTHSSGMQLEILDADSRRVHRIKISHIPPIEARE